MNNNNPYAIERFNRVLEKADAGDLFDEYASGCLAVYAHNGRTIDTFRIVVEFPNDSVLVTTQAGLAVEEKNYERVKVLLESINEIIPCGIFFISEDKNISFAVRCEFSRFEALENPVDFIFYGGETIGKYTESILRTLLGGHVYYLKG